AIGELDGGQERRRRPDERRVAGRGARGRIAELEECIADAHDVAGPELAGLDAGSVHEGAVPAALIADLNARTDARDRRMLAIQLWIVERDVAVRARDPPETQSRAEVEATGDHRADRGMKDGDGLVGLHRGLGPGAY